jgi:putative Mg2+ transporter-C (MgtC) family protein
MSLSFSYVGLEQVVLRLLAAVVLAFVIGLDRELRNKPVGLRTFMLVSLGAAAFSLVIMELTQTIRPEGHIAMDPSRVAEGIIGGIGFLGAGAIIQGARGVVGATTGASIWVVGGVGMACGFGFYVHAAVTTAIAAVVLTILGMVEARLFGRSGKPPPDEGSPE